MANKGEYSIDHTRLSFGQANAKGFLHRDYLAHCTRWSHVVKFMNEGKKCQTAHVLDVGCGGEVALARVMFSMRKTHTTGSFTGVDHGAITWPATIAKDSSVWNMQLFPKADFATVKLPRKQYDIVTCFEVLEHVEGYHCFKMLQRMRELVAKDGHALLSTPCYSVEAGAANNHVNEMSHDAFRMLIELAGFQVVEVYGTFANQRDYKKLLSREQKIVFDQLSVYYDTEMMAILFAPLFPEQARNCMWVLKPGKSVWPAEGLEYWKKPTHGSSKQWPADVARIFKEKK